MRKESTWRRAWQDTESFRKSAKSFWLFEVVGAVIFGILGTLFLPQSVSSIIRSGVGIIVGFIIVFILVFGWNLFRAPYNQRNEAYKESDVLAEKMAYSLEVQGIAPMWSSGIKDNMGIEFRLKNRFESPLKYQIKTIECILSSKWNPTNFVNNGGVIYDEAEYSIPNLLFVSEVKPIYTGVINFKILYGKPDHAIKRLLDASAKLEVNGDKCTCFWLKRKEETINEEFTEQIPIVRQIQSI